MRDPASIVLASWVVLSVVLFARSPGRTAVLVSILGGWALLPTARYPASVFAEPFGQGGSMHALAIPTLILVNKATAIAIGCLAGSILFDWPALRRFRPGWVDLPILVWCLVPVASAIANGSRTVEGMAQSRYLVLAWGVPYLLGRIYLSDADSLRRMALGWVVVGVLSVPFCLIEFVHGPFLYGLVYGAHPYQWEGAKRFLGNRPLVFLEHGNQLGMVMACASVSAVWLWKAGQLPAVARLPGGVVAAVLVAVCLLCQSHTAIALMLVSLAPLLVLKQKSTGGVGPGKGKGRVVAAIVLAGVIGLGAVLAAWQARDPGVRSQVRGLFAAVGKNSFTWRLARSEEYLPRIAQRPILGWGRADWLDRPFVNPINLGLWLLTLGMYGIIGLASSSAVLAWPVFKVFRQLPGRSWLRPEGAAVVVTALLLAINLVDSLLNSGWLLPLLAGAGGLNSWSSRTAEAGTVPESPTWRFDHRTGLFQSSAERRA